MGPAVALSLEGAAKTTAISIAAAAELGVDDGLDRLLTSLENNYGKDRTDQLFG